LTAQLCVVPYGEVSSPIGRCWLAER